MLFKMGTVSRFSDNIQLTDEELLLQLEMDGPAFENKEVWLKLFDNIYRNMKLSGLRYK